MSGPTPLARLFIAAAHKSSGKTTITIGLAAALSATGLRVQCFKKGPDYIDPMWLSRAAMRPCYNLDFNTMGHIEIGSTFAGQSAGCDISLIEANKGLFDGLDPEGVDSNAALAKLLGAPVILVIDCEGMTRGIAPLVLGYVAFDQDVAIKGVILNNVGGPRHESKLRAAMARYTDVPVLGAVARNKELAISERHLGLTTPGEIDVRDDKIKSIGDLVGAGVELDALKAIAQVPLPLATKLSPAVGEVSVAASTLTSTLPSLAPAEDRSAAATAPRAPPVRIAIARDAAFGFYYADDLAALEKAGAQLVPFNTLRDEALPPLIDGLFIGGGFPETHMAALSNNTALRDDIKQVIEAGLPSYAECGGLMYLSRSLSWRGKTCDMVGVIAGDAIMHERPQGRGYVQLRERASMPWGALESREPQFKAHEFHYASLNNLPYDTTFAYDVKRGHGIDGRHDGIAVHNLLANFSHLRDTGANHWAARFVNFVQSQRSEL